jgi:hypothetical protein
MEKESILKSTYDELQSKSLISNSYHTHIDNDHIRNLIEASWSNFLGIFSQLLADFDETTIVTTCTDNILLIARMCGILRLDTISEAFINTIINMSSIMEGREIKQKNFDCAKALIEFSIQSGNYIRSCWYHILNIISKIEYYHTIGGQYKNEAELFEKEIRRRSRTKNPDREIELELRNTEFICKNFSPIICDNIYSKTTTFDEEGIVEFICAMCKVSQNELDNFFNPRNYSLHKLVEVADFNMFRIQIEWAKIWKLISDHLVYVATNFNHDNICIDAIDTLRQIVIKLLKKPDLEGYTFQIDFFKPFDIIFNQSVNRPSRSELILTCLAFIVQNSKNIQSGWVIIFSILKNGFKRKDSRLNEEIVKILENISEDMAIFNSNQEVFRGYIECLCHMYLEESLKKLAFETILKLISRITSSTIGEKRFEYLKIFFYGLDDLLGINVIEHTNLLFEVISYNRDLIFSSDILSFIHLYYCYFKPHIVTILLSFYNYRLNMIEENSCFAEFSRKSGIEEIYYNTKTYLKHSLNNVINLQDKSGDHLKLTKNGGTETKKHITTFLKNIQKSYDRDIDLIIKKIEVFKTEYFEVIENYESLIDFFVEKFYFMIQQTSDAYMDYLFFYEDLLTTMNELSIFSRNYIQNYKILSKNILAYTITNSTWETIGSQIRFSLKNMTKFNNTNNFADSISFITHLIEYFNEIISTIRYSDLLEEFHLINKIFIRVIQTDNDKDEKNIYKIVSNNDTLNLLKYLSKARYHIISNECHRYYDESSVIIFLKLIELFDKYELFEEEKSDLIEIIIFEIEKIITKLLAFYRKEELMTVYTNLVDLIDTKCLELRKEVKSLIGKYLSEGLISFKDK